MAMRKKRILKEDGRYLIYYCFKDDSACPGEGVQHQQPHERACGAESLNTARRSGSDQSCYSKHKDNSIKKGSC
ncbi:MAG: hypothetical protein HPY52_04830 [Firmicutes bacterium]|nr:hypothetical protein [Bacillota bacterium]